MDMKRLFGTYIFVLVLLAVTACTGGESTKTVPQSSDTLYTEQAVLDIYDTLPQRALQLLDSAVVVGTMPRYRADMLRAKVYCASCEAAQYDSAIVIGERLMLHDSIKANPRLQQDVLSNLQYACRLLHDDERAMYWATQLSQLYRQHGEETEALRTDAEIGKYLVSLGEQQKGLARIDSVIGELEGAERFNELDASIIALKLKAESCYEKGRHAEMIPAARRMLELLSEYEQAPDAFHDGNYREPPEEQRPGYIDFYRGKAYGYLAMASLREKGRGESEALAAARHYVDLFDQTDYGKTLDGRYFIALTVGRMGQYDRMLATYDEYEPAFISDTLSLPYAELLYNRAEAAAAQGRYAAAYNLMERYAALTEQLSDSVLQGKAHLYAARFHAQEQQQEIEHQKGAKRYVTMVAFLVGILAILGLSFAWYAARQWHRTQLKNRVLAQQMKEAIIYKEKYESLATEAHKVPEAHKTHNAPEAPPSAPEGATIDPTFHSKTIEAPSGAEGGAYPSGAVGGASGTGTGALDSLSPEELFHYIEHEVSRRLLFLNPSFDRKMIMDEFHLSKERVGAAFSQGSKYDSLPQFVSNLRLEYASKLLVTTDLSISEIMAKAGFSNASVFSRYFSRKFQISPTQYRRANSEQR